MGSQTGRSQTGQSSQEVEREADVGEVPQSVQGSGNMEAVVEKQNESSSGGELFGNVGHERWQIVTDLEGPTRGAEVTAIMVRGASHGADRLTKSEDSSHGSSCPSSYPRKVCTSFGQPVVGSQCETCGMTELLPHHLP